MTYTESRNLLKTCFFILGIAFLLVVWGSISENKKAEERKPIYAGDYTIVLHYDTVWLYDGERLVSKYINTRWDSQLDSIILKDNE